MKIIRKVMLSVTVVVLLIVTNKIVIADVSVLAPLTLDFQDESFEFRGSGGEGLVSFNAIKISGKGESATLSWNKKVKWDVYDVSNSNKTVDISSQKKTKDCVARI